MATLVTGGTGFVGSNLVRTLAQRGHQVICSSLFAFTSRHEQAHILVNTFDRLG